jgi:flagellar biogenesis protein FliO
MDYVRQMAAVGAVFLLLGGLLWWMRRRGFAKPGRARGRRRIEVLERLALGPQHTLHVVRWDGAALLVACSPAGCTLIDRTAGAVVADTVEAVR